MAPPTTMSEGWNAMLAEPSDYELMNDDNDNNNNNNNNNHKKTERIHLECKPLWRKFLLKEKNFKNQYSHVYTIRQLKLRKILREQAERKWGNTNNDKNQNQNQNQNQVSSLKIVEKAIELEEGEVSCIIGLLHRDMVNRPSVLDEFRDAYSLEGPLKAQGTRFGSKSDAYLLEDESGRVTLTFDEEALLERLKEEEEGKKKKDQKNGIVEGKNLYHKIENAFITGVVCALKGKVLSNGKFYVSDWCFAGLPDQINNNNNNDKRIDDDMDMDVDVDNNNNNTNTNNEYVLLVSGITCGGKQDSLPLQLLVDYIGGHLEGEYEQNKYVSKIGKVIIAGNLVSEIDTMQLNEKNISKQQQAEISNPIRVLDMAIAQIASTIPVHIMPGTTDPSNLTLPQQPLSKCLLPHSSKYNTVKYATNPYEAEIAGKLFMGTSGQNVKDLEKFLIPEEEENNDKEEEGNDDSQKKKEVVVDENNNNNDNNRSLDSMENMLQWRHIAPSAPDTLPCYPFADHDPFILEDCPHVFFSGNESSFATRLVKGNDGQSCRLICIPSFAETKEVVLLNVKTLEVEKIKFEGFLTDM